MPAVPTEVVKVGVLQPLHSPAYPGAVDASDSIVTFQLTHYLMDCLTQQVRPTHVGIQIQTLTQTQCMYMYVSRIT